MIRLLKLIERWRRHPLLGPLVTLFLVVLIVLIALHEGHESVADDIGVLCVGIVVLLLTAIVAASFSPTLTSFDAVVTLRGPPALISRLFLIGRDPTRCFPLRL